MTDHVRRCVLVAALTLAGVLPARGQGKFPPDSFTNLKVLPKNIAPRDLIATMRGFALSLGVRCTYCHVGEEGQPLSTYKFAADDKRPKRVARVMIDMVNHINQEHLRDVPDRPTPLLEVRCETCHRGLARPKLLADTMNDVLAAQGLDSAVRVYRALRERYYGSGSYNFSERGLLEIAGAAAAGGRRDQAIGLLLLSEEFNPQSAQTQLALGDAYRQTNDTAKALDRYRKALALDTTLTFLRQRIADLTRH